MAQPSFQFSGDTPVRCGCTNHSLNKIPKDQQTFAIASRLFGQFFCEDCSPHSPDSANAGLDLCTVTRNSEGGFSLPLAGLLKCNVCESKTALGNIPSQNQLESILGALAGNYICQDCQEKKSKPLSQKELSLEWLKQNGCCYESEAKKFLSDLPRAMDVFYPHGNKCGFAVVTDEFRDATAISSPTVTSKGGEEKRFVLVRSKEESSAVLWELYRKLSHAENAHKTALFEKSRTLRERELDLKKAERNLFQALRGFLIPNKVEFSIDVTLSEAPAKKSQEEEGNKRGREEEEEEPIIIDLVSEEEEQEQEEVVTKKKLKSRNRIPTLRPAGLYLKQFVSSKIEAQRITRALKDRWAQHCEKRGVTVVRVRYSTAAYLMHQGVLDSTKVSPPFNSRQPAIEQGKHFVLVVLTDPDLRIYKEMSTEKSQEELLNLIHPVPELDLSNFQLPEFLSEYCVSPVRTLEEEYEFNTNKP